jgi:hypothetical protein
MALNQRNLNIQSNPDENRIQTGIPVANQLLSIYRNALQTVAHVYVWNPKSHINARLSIHLPITTAHGFN